MIPNCGCKPQPESELPQSAWGPGPVQYTGQGYKVFRMNHGGAPTVYEYPRGHESGLGYMPVGTRQVVDWGRVFGVMGIFLATVIAWALFIALIYFGILSKLVNR